MILEHVSVYTDVSFLDEVLSLLMTLEQSISRYQLFLEYDQDILYEQLGDIMTLLDRIDCPVAGTFNKAIRKLRTLQIRIIGQESVTIANENTATVMEIPVIESLLPNDLKEETTRKWLSKFERFQTLQAATSRV